MACPPAQPVKQLDGTTFANVNCGPASACMALDHASCGSVTATPDEMRARGAMGNGATGFGDLKRGIAAYAPEFAAKGLQPPALIRLGYIDLTTFAESLVRRSAFHIVAIDYGDVPDAYNSDRAYDGSHFVTARTLYRRKSDGSFVRLRPYNLTNMRPATLMSLWTEVLDPLADHRRAAIPQAPQRWPLKELFAAADAFYDAGVADGKLTAAVIYRAQEAA